MGVFVSKTNNVTLQRLTGSCKVQEEQKYLSPTTYYGDGVVYVVPIICTTLRVFNIRQLKDGFGP